MSDLCWTNWHFIISVFCCRDHSIIASYSLIYLPLTHCIIISYVSWQCNWILEKRYDCLGGICIILLQGSSERGMTVGISSVRLRPQWCLCCVMQASLTWWWLRMKNTSESVLTSSRSCPLCFRCVPAYRLVHVSHNACVCFLVCISCWRSEKLEFLAAMLKKHVFWVCILYQWLSSSQNFEELQWLHLEGFRVQHSILLRLLYQRWRWALRVAPNQGKAPDWKPGIALLSCHRLFGPLSPIPLIHMGNNEHTSYYNRHKFVSLYV